MTRAILLDVVPASFSAAPDDTVITLTAEAEYECGRRGIPHLTVSDVVSEAELAALEARYWSEQLAWMDVLEERLVALSATLRETGLRPLMAAGYPLKLLVDGTFVKAFDSNQLTRGAWDTLVHYHRGEGELHAQLLPAFCAASGIAYVPVAPGASPHAKGAGSLLAAVLPRAGSAREHLRRLRVHAGQASVTPASLMVTSRHGDCGQLMHANRRAGGSTFFLDRDTILDVSAARARHIGTLEAPTADDHAEWRIIAAAIRNDEAIAAWPRSWFDGEAADVLLDRLTVWISTFLPEVVSRARTFLGVLPELGLDVIAAPYLSTPPEIAVFAASRAAPQERVSTVVIEHGDTAFAAPSWDFQLLAADAFLATNEELASYFRERAATYDRPTARIEVGSYRWQRNAIAAAPQARSRRAALALYDGPRALALARDDRPILVYLVTATTGDLKYLNNAWYPDAWYFELQRRIIETLGQQERFRVVVKLFPGGGNAPNPIGRWISEFGAPNVAASRAPFRSWLPWAERVLTDFPSTGLYESLVAGVPTLSLLWEHHHLRPGAIAALGSAGAMFRTPTEATRIVSAFADGPPPTVPDFHPEGPPIIDTLAALFR